MANSSRGSAEDDKEDNSDRNVKGKAKGKGKASVVAMAAPRSAAVGEEPTASSALASSSSSSAAKRKIDDISNGNADGEGKTANEGENGAPDVVSSGLSSAVPSSSSLGSASTAHAASNGGARPKTRRADPAPSTSAAAFENGYFDQLAPQNGGSDADLAANDDDECFGIACNGVSNGTANGGDDDSCQDFYVADLPKSFYQLEEDAGSDSEGGMGGGGAQGVSGAGQSNLSSEVAALIKSEMMRPRLRLSADGRDEEARGEGDRRRRRRRRNANAAPVNGAAAAVPDPDAGAADVDFLEMDFDDESGDGDDSGDSDDSGQGGDENVTETNEEDDDSPEDESVPPLELEERSAGGNRPLGAGALSPTVPSLSRLSLDDHQESSSVSGATAGGSGSGSLSRRQSESPRPASSVSPRIPEHLALECAEQAGERPKRSSADAASVPAVTPVRDDPPSSSSTMVRSQSLNSQLVGQMQAKLANCCVARVESDPAGDRIRQHRRRLSGPSAAAAAAASASDDNGDDPALDMEICGARLSQREALMFGFSSASAITPTTAGSTVDGVQQALVKLRMSSEGGAQSQQASSSRPIPRIPLLEKAMIWTEREACARQVTQIGVSACGATAVINALLALDVPHATAQVADEVATRRRAETAPLPDYLLSRSSAGATHRDLVAALESHYPVRCRFFHMYPRRAFEPSSLSHWLADWIGRGAVPIATLNLQRGVKQGQTVPDAWHHQMIFGVGPDGVYLTNPLESTPEELLLEQLCSPSELLVRRRDVLIRFDPATCDLSELSAMSDERWDDFNVLGQVVNVLREAGSKSSQKVKTEHVRIPADYR